MDSISTGAPFAQKRIDLNSTVKIGRKVNVKAGPEPSNGIFDSKVLSRNHAEIWFEGGKVWIKDVKSSNGTFINNIRLSEEGQASAPHELKTGDTVEFGIDIMNDDGMTVMYYKVSSKIMLWDPAQGPLPPPSNLVPSRSGDNWGAVPAKKATVKMDAVFNMLDKFGRQTQRLTKSTN
ncbi:SMAD/FHA domain-containing protein [Obelidium mucronatum]|nr:SMAD/FHA domain-containing protein [Obelidium mucronatum]